jgi:hypothetical protein
MSRWSVVAAGCLLMPGLAAQNGTTARVLCDPTDGGNQCPGLSCRCSEDVLAIRFDRSGGPILEIEDAPGLSIEATVVLETKSAGVQGWSYGVRHDGRALTIESVTTDGTDAGHVINGGSFNATRFKGLSECTSDPSKNCSNPEPGAGFISAVVLAFGGVAELPVGTNSLAKATYRLEPDAAEVGKAGVLLEITDRLAARNAPPVAINFTVIGKGTQPNTLVDGRILVSPRPFHRGDPDGDGRLSVADAVALLLFLFLAGPSPGCLEAGDADDSGRIDTTDPVIILRWLFLGGSAPALPGPPPAPCGPDPAGSSLGCAMYAGC